MITHGAAALVGPWIVLTALALLEAIASLRGGFRLARRFSAARRDLVTSGDRTPWGPDGAAGAGEDDGPSGTDPTDRGLPGVCLVLPFRGVDPGMSRNLDAYFQLDYPRYRILLVTGSEADPSLPDLRAARQRHRAVPADILVAGPAHGRGQKVHNLLHATGHLRPTDEVLAFGDSDSRPRPDWLRRLVSPLSDPAIGASTGFRWYLPPRGGFASRLRSAWNAGILSLMTGDASRFAWGGAMALRRATFERCGVAEAWRGAVSDDYALSRAVRSHGLRIRFEPRCLSFSHEDCDLGELLQWSHRQLTLTRVYDPALWRSALGAQLVHSAALWGTVALLGAALLGVGLQGAALQEVAGVTAIAGPAAPGGAPLPLTGLGVLSLLALTTYGLGCWKSRLRLRAVASLFPARAGEILRHRRAHVLLGPLASLVSLQGLLRSLGSRQIEWRGIRYRMLAPDRTEIVSRRDGSVSE